MKLYDTFIIKNLSSGASIKNLLMSSLLKTSDFFALYFALVFFNNVFNLKKLEISIFSLKLSIVFNIEYIDHNVDDLNVLDCSLKNAIITFSVVFCILLFLHQSLKYLYLCSYIFFYLSGISPLITSSATSFISGGVKSNKSSISII